MMPSFVKWDAWRAVTESGTLLIERLGDADEALNVARAAIDGGVRAIEVTLSVPGALDVIERLARQYAGCGVAIGAGTVLDAPAAYACVQAGAHILVSPNLNPDMLTVANRYKVLAIGGALTPTEIVNTLTAGADMVKIFPTTSIGPAYVKAVREPLPQAPIVPTGGVTVGNVADWFDAGAVAVGVGSTITKAARVDGDYSRVTAAAKQFLAAIRDIRNKEADS
jgi:2-dehydro-3-deoxyphosphogluconate aldolase/(4S)-4-hydroxy-2-oxoglutarate aldolase